MKPETEEIYISRFFYCWGIGTVLVFVSVVFGYLDTWPADYIILLVAGGFIFVGAFFFVASLSSAVWREPKEYIIKEEDDKREHQKLLDSMASQPKINLTLKQAEEVLEWKRKETEKQSKKEGEVEK